MTKYCLLVYRCTRIRLLRVERAQNVVLSTSQETGWKSLSNKSMTFFYQVEKENSNNLKEKLVRIAKRMSARF